jgi:hypothetical protein
MGRSGLRIHMPTRRQRGKCGMSTDCTNDSCKTNRFAAQKKRAKPAEQ